MIQPNFDPIRDADKSLDAKFPEIAAEWHPTKNGDLTAKAIPAWSDQTVYWHCRKCNNEWTSRVDSRTLDDLCCPTCKRVDFELMSPYLTAHRIIHQLHPELNPPYSNPLKKITYELNEANTTTRDLSTFWWLCEYHGDYQATVLEVARSGDSCCPVCARSLAVKNSNLAKEWHPTKNGDLTPRDISAGSAKKAWWLCQTCGHEWNTGVRHRNGGRRCPICSKQKLVKGKNDLYTKFPEIAAEWHSTKNGYLTPHDISAGSGKKVWWLGACGHEWDAVVVNRTRYNYGCPFESGRRLLAGFNDLATKSPEIAAEWHPTKNGDLTPDQILAGSNKKVWWLGICGHEWDAFVKNRTEKNAGCPFEVKPRTKLLTGSNDLATKFPEIAAEWHPTRNGDLTPDKITASKHQKVWWLGKCGHEWDATVASRTGSNFGCPFESGQRLLSGFNDLATKFSEIAAEWHPTKNGDLTPDQISAGSIKRVWWLGKCGHTWDAAVSSRTGQKTGCPFCSGRHVFAGFNDLATKFPEISAEWHPTKNGDLTPDQISAGSNKKIWWLGVCGHEWYATVVSRTANKTGCPFESGKRILAGFNDLATKFPEIAAEWHPTKNGDLTPDKISASNSTKFWWLGVCGHEWYATVVSRTGNKQGCPFDSGKLLLTGFNDLETTFHDISAEWHPTKNGDITPDQILAGNYKKVWWLGECGHEWYASVRSRTVNKTGCPFCSGKRVLAGFNDLATTFPEIAAEWHPIKNGYLRLDETSASSDEKVWWLGACGHEWHRTVVNRITKKTGCPFKSCHRTSVG